MLVIPYHYMRTHHRMKTQPISTIILKYETEVVLLQKSREVV